MKNNKKKNNNQNKKRQLYKKLSKPPVPRNAQRIYRRYCMAVLISVIVYMMAATAFATGTPNDPLAVINNLSDFIFGIIRAVGMILLGFGIVQIGLSLKSHDPSQRANGFLTLTGGVIITFAKEILNIITG
jgi:hypothetical protein